MKGIVYGALALAAVAAAGPVAAQSPVPLALEVRGGAAIPMGDFGDAWSAETGVIYGVGVILQATPMFGVYGSFERAEFGIDDTAGIGEGDLVDQGFAFGGVVSLPMGGMSGIAPWIRGGAVYNQLTRDGSTGTDFETDRKLGYEVGGGVSIPLGMVVSFEPAVRYRSYSPETGLTGDGPNVSYLATDLGLRFRF